MSCPRQPRLPLQPLLHATAVASKLALARRLGVDPTLIHRAARRGGVTYWTADRWAVALGWHPAMIWPEWLEEETDAA